MRRLQLIEVFLAWWCFLRRASFDKFLFSDHASRLSSTVQSLTSLLRTSCGPVGFSVSAVRLCGCSRHGWWGPWWLCVCVASGSRVSMTRCEGRTLLRLEKNPGRISVKYELLRVCCYLWTVGTDVGWFRGSVDCRNDDGIAVA